MCPYRYCFTPTKEDKEQVLQRFENDLTVPKNFVRTAPAHEKGTPKKKSHKLTAVRNPQTVQFCETLAIEDPLQLISENTGIPLSLSMEESFNNTTFIEDTFEIDEFKPSQSSPMKKLGNLSLPQPKMEPSTPDLNESDCIAEDVEDNNGTKSKTEHQDDSQNEKDQVSEPNIATEVVLESVNQPVKSDNDEEAAKESKSRIEEKPSDSPTPKKLKRRNENLYKN